VGLGQQREGPPLGKETQPVSDLTTPIPSPRMASESGHAVAPDRWAKAYASRAHGVTKSEILALFAVANQPEVVSFAGGLPFVAALPLDVVGDAVAGLLANQGVSALQYGASQGDLGLRERILDVMTLQRVVAHPDDIVVTSGSQHALELVTRTFVDPGDVVATEAPTYVGALGAFRSYQADVVQIPLDGEGLIPAAFEETVLRVNRAGRRVKLLYTIPNHQNPTGITLSVRRRPQIMQIAQRFGILVLEDDPYGLLGFDEDPLPALHHIDPDGVVYLGTFSKIFAPGLRVGWAVAPRVVREKLVLASETSILTPTSFGQLTVSAYLDTYDWMHQVRLFRQLYRERSVAMLEALADLLPTMRWTIPRGGFFVWAHLPHGLDAQTMLPRAVQAGVAYVPGSAFYADGGGHDNEALRLSYSLPTPDRIRQGICRLAGVVAMELQR
jgi:2-aminoadipate transaminase